MALKVTQIRSSIGTKPKQRGTLRALGLGRIGKSLNLTLEEFLFVLVLILLMNGFE